MTDLEIVSNIKSLGIDMINNAGSGHPGIVLSSAPILYSLYAYHLNINPIDPKWFNRDRFVLSAGHGSALLYATLFMSGYSLTIDDLKSFRKVNSKTPGHPEVGVTPGVDCSTGALGQGIGMAVGMALGEKILKERYRVASNESLIDYNVYCLVGDGDLMEGISYESASLAGNLK
jgi:transketolase